MSSERYNISLTALIVGVPILIGASWYYLYYSQRREKGNGGSGGQDGKIKNTNSESKKLSPLEQIKHIKETGNQNFSRKNYTQAIEHYTKGIELSESMTPTVKSEDLAVLYQNRAAANEALGSPEKVIEDCSKAIELNKNYAKAYLRRARAFEKLQRYDEALVDAFCTNILEKFQNQNTIRMAENIVQASSKAKADEAMKTHIFDWPADHMIKTYFAAFTRDPIREKLGDVVISSHSQLQDLFEESKKSENENDPYYMVIRGTCLTLMGDLKGADVIFDQILAMSDESCPAHIKANASLKKSALLFSEPNATSQFEKDLDSSLGLIEQAAKLDPENPDVYLHLGQTMTLMERLEDAIDNLDKAIKLHPGFHAAIAQKLYLEFKLETKDSFSSRRPEKLLKKFEVALKENDDAPDIQRIYAQALSEVNSFEQADQVYSKLIKQDPNDFNAVLSRALLQFHLKSDPDEIECMMKDIIKMNPKNLVAYEILGSLESQQGKIDNGIELFETALKHAQSEMEYRRCYSLLDSAKSQRAAVEQLGTQV